MITDPVFYAIAVPAILLLGISKGGFGGGIAMLGVPALSLVTDPITAAAILLPILCVMDAVSIGAYRKTWDGEVLKLIVPAALVGIAIGWFAFRFTSVAAIQVLVGLIAVVFSADYWAKRWGWIAPAKDKPSRAAGGFWATVCGFTSFIAHAGSPPLSVYMLPLRLNKTIYVGTTVIFYTVVNYVKIVPYSMLGQFSGVNLTTSLVLLPLAAIGAYLGVRLHRVIPEQLFYTVCYVIVFIVGLRLIFKGVSDFLA